MVRRGIVFMVAASIALGGCSGTRRTPLPASAVTTEQFYVGVDGLAVYAEASGAAPVVGRLPLHARVARSALVRGYAHVVADGSGLAGWVDNGKLLWRLPAPGGAAAPTTAVEGETPAPAEAVETESVPSDPTPASSPPETPPSPANPF